jgi:membrane fusion protein (multidrug efflux system)
MLRFTIAALAAVLTVGCSSGRDEPEVHPVPATPIPVKVDVIRADPWPDNWEAPGFVTSDDPVTVVARMTGVIKRVAVSKGQRVRAGDILVVFDIRDVDDSVDRAARSKPASAEEVRQAGEAVEVARLDLGAAKTDEARRAARTALEGALNRQAELRSRNSGVESARMAGEALRDAATVLAPSSGKITDLYAASGKLVTAQTQLIRYAPEGKRVEASVLTRKLGGAVEGSDVSVDFGNGCREKTKIAEIVESQNAERKIVRAPLPCKAGSGARGRVLFTGPPHPAITVAKAALVRGAERPSVFLVEDGFARLRRITTGDSRDDRVEAIAGLAPGSRVVLEPPANLKDNAPVAVLPEAKAEQPGPGR